ncbi:hypothetical protein RND71_019373 [Anisodus tanguticus]|uniref:Uncharacterized protein n=1 Tax=Anisodus tanguticus TaxID=243964 RepID=A0AAE1RYZ6_9SOLA|nr:hypothetical protein RND71_019373 [Anisodus tanguticus]
MKQVMPFKLLSPANLENSSEPGPLNKGASPEPPRIAVDKSVDVLYEELSNASDNCITAYNIGQVLAALLHHYCKAAIKENNMQGTKEFLAELKVLTNVRHLNLVRPWVTNLPRESFKKVNLIQEKFLAAQNRQKMYADWKVQDIEFMEGEHVLLKISPMKDGSYIIRWDFVLLDENLSYEEEPIAILDRHVRKLRSKDITFVKVQWKHRPAEEGTREIRVRYTC